MYAPRYVTDDQLPAHLYSQILPGLYQGGTDDDDWINTGFSPLTPAATGAGFDAVLTLFAWAQPFGWGSRSCATASWTPTLAHADMTRVVEAARWAHQRWASGQQVLIRCQAGLNRSGLLTALVLMLAGFGPRGRHRADPGKARRVRPVQRRLRRLAARRSGRNSREAGTQRHSASGLTLVPYRR